MPEAEDVQTLDPVDDWSQVDPDYEYIPAGDDGQDDTVEDPEELDEDLTDEEIEVPDDLSDLLPFWVSYELHGRNLDAETTWERLAVEDFDGELEVEVDGLTAGARWEFRVRLIDRDGRHSRFSDALVIDLPTDFTPPPAPTEPIIRDVRGYTAVGWDGLLQGPIPADMSHVQLYVQQQHPEGDPDGEPGDPRRITTMPSAGEHPLLQFLANVLHKAWFTAVDTTGNESPWSPQVEFTPTPPVNTDAIEAELEDARDRLEQAEQDLASGMADRVAEIEYLRETRIPALQDALTTGLDDVYRDAQAYAEAQADDAVNRAAADAQTEYDRLQEIAERALSRAGDNVLEDPSFETDYWVDEWSGLGGNPRTIQRVSEPRTGDYSLSFGAGSTWNFRGPELQAEADQSWRMSIWYRSAPGGSTGSTSTRLRFIETDSTTAFAESDTFTLSSQWTRATLVHTFTEETHFLPALHVAQAAVEILVDDISVQEVGAAAEALRLAEVARQQAEAAHTAAGNAVDVAANAYDAASAKNTIHWSLSAPSGTADSTDDVWWQYELRNGRRVVTGQWFWDNGVWRETEIAEEWLPLVNIGTGTYGTFTGDRLEANTVRAGALAVMPDGQNFAPDLANYADAWTLGGDVRVVANSFATDGYALRIPGDASSVSGRAYGPWLPAKPGDTIYYSFNVSWWNALPDGELRAYFMFDGSLTVGWVRAERVTSTGTVEGYFTVPDGVGHSVAFGVNIDAAATNNGDWAVRNFDVRLQTKGVLIQDGAVNSQKVNTEEFFAAQAVIEAIWTDIVRSRLIQSQGIITEDMIATGAITTPKLTVTEEMVGEVARLLRIEAGSLASNDIEAMRIVSSLIEATTYLIHNADGDVSVRLDGMDNYIAGRLHAGMTETEGIVLDWGEKVRYSGLTDEGDPAPVRTITTPYFNFHTDNTDYEPGAEPSIYLERDSATGERDGMMIINPGYPTGTDAFRGTLNVVGDALANRFTPRERLQINTSHSDQPGVLQSSGQGLRIRGQIPSSSHSQEMFYVGQTDLATLAAGGRRKRTLSWGVPVPRGRRDPIGTVYLQGASSNNNARVEMNISQRTTTSYRLDEYNNSSVDAGYWVGIIAPWRNV